MNGVVINIHALGATVRLDDGSLAAVPIPEAAKFRSQLTVSLQRKRPIPFSVRTLGRHRLAFPGEAEPPAAEAPEESSTSGPRNGQSGLRDGDFEAMMNAYLKSVEEREPPDLPAPAERHFIRKKRRASFFEGRGKED